MCIYIYTYIQRESERERERERGEDRRGEERGRERERDIAIELTRSNKWLLVGLGHFLHKWSNYESQKLGLSRLAAVSMTSSVGQRHMGQVSAVTQWHRTKWPAGEPLSSDGESENCDSGLFLAVNTPKTPAKDEVHQTWTHRAERDLWCC